MTLRLAAALEARKVAGAKSFVPYVTGGAPGVDAGLLRSLEAEGADVIEVGLPFSDPGMDGPVIQEASRRALAGGATPTSVLDLVAGARLDVPVALMTYLNPVLAYGYDRFAVDAAAAGVSGFIVPDLPVDEADDWLEVCAANDEAPVLLAAPNAARERLVRIAAASRGFVYCVASLGVTGPRSELPGSARALVASLRALTDTPLLVGVGISSPAQAAEAASFADGAIVGTALVETLLAGDPRETLRRAHAFRDALGV
jgi:tryptophan synthase alpha chain